MYDYQSSATHTNWSVVLCRSVLFSLKHGLGSFGLVLLSFSSFTKRLKMIFKVLYQLEKIGGKSKVQEERAERRERGRHEGRGGRCSLCVNRQGRSKEKREKENT